MCNYKEDLKKKEERIGGLVNLITDYAIEHEMSAKEIDECVDIAKEVFYSNAIVRRPAPEVPVQEQSTDWIKKLAKEISICLPIHDILSK